MYETKTARLRRELNQGKGAHLRHGDSNSILDLGSAGGGRRSSVMSIERIREEVESVYIQLDDSVITMDEKETYN